MDPPETLTPDPHGYVTLRDIVPLLRDRAN